VNPDRPARPRARRGGRAGFSFTEVLFAVMILGVGFIMVDAIFPVAIQQAQTSTEETTGAAVSRGAVNYIEKVANNSTMPATGDVVVGPEFDGVPPTGSNPDWRDGFTLAAALRGSAVVASDGRYGWVPLYRRAGDPQVPSTWSPFAQVIMVPVVVRNETEYATAFGPAGNPMSKGAPVVLQNLTGIRGTAMIQGDMVNGINGEPDRIVFETQLDVPSEGAFVVIADAQALGKQVAPHLNGRIFRLGNRYGDTVDTWELMPGFDLEPIRIDADGNAATGVAPTPLDGKEVVAGGSGAGGVALNDVYFFVIGRGLDQNDPTGVVRTGTAQDVSAYSTFVPVN
jgi:hypothetical protein